MHYKLQNWIVDELISFISEATHEYGAEFLYTKEAITGLVYESIKEGDYILVPVDIVKKAIDVPNNGFVTHMSNKRKDIIMRLFDCDIVQYQPMQGWWKIPYHDRENEFIYLTSTQYYEAKGFLDAGRKIHAIKVIREATGMGLKPAKEMAEETFILAKKVDKKGD